MLMFGTIDYEKIQRHKKSFLFYNCFFLILMNCFQFTFVIPGLKGFQWPWFFIHLCLMALFAYIFTAIFDSHVLPVFAVSLSMTTLGMLSRLWLEWGEYSMLEHMNWGVYIGFPVTITAIIMLFYYLFLWKIRT